MASKKLFWLHIKKSGGITTRSLLQPYYIEVDRSKKPTSFLQAKPEEYNDILNNYRVPLGNFQFRRSLFAKTYLYPDNWDSLFSFAFSRNPLDRCISMFYALYWRDKGLITRFKSTVTQTIKTKKFHYNTRYAFDVFLDFLQESKTSQSNYSPLGIQFTTHTAPMWEDVTDQDGNILLKKIFRLEHLTDGINQAYEACGINQKIEQVTKVLNANRYRSQYQPTTSQINKIQSLYKHDFEIYENAG